MRVAYVTDVEGSYTKLRTFVEATDGVAFDGSGRIVVDDGFVFVFGGDAIDRGPRSRLVCQLLLDVKLRQPERVILLAGNRDINKLRIPRELDGAVPKRAPPEVAALVHDRKPELLRWIFSNTMGAQPAFEHRRSELKDGGFAHGDDDVVRSILTDLMPPGGLHVRYLAQTQLAFRLGKTLYVHGGIGEEALGYVPAGGDHGESFVDDVDGWVFDLNAFYRAQLRLFDEHPVERDRDPPWLPVVLYQAPLKGVGRNPKSVVYGRFGSDPWNNPRLPSRASLLWLAERGIARVVVGHTPCGDLPAVLRAPPEWGAPVEIVIADNSRGSLDHGNSVVIDDDAIHVRAKVCVDGDGDLAARTRDVDYVLGRDDTTSPLGKHIGQLTADGHLVKAVVDDVAHLFRFEHGFTLHQQTAALGALGALHAPVDVPPA